MNTSLLVEAVSLSRVPNTIFESYVGSSIIISAGSVEFLIVCLSVWKMAILLLCQPSITTVRVLNCRLTQ